SASVRWPRWPSSRPPCQSMRPSSPGSMLSIGPGKCRSTGAVWSGHGKVPTGNACLVPVPTANGPTRTPRCRVSSTRPWPVQPRPALPPGGLLITQVLPGGSAAQGRLQAGDVLVAYAGQDLTSFEQLGKLIAAKAGEKVVVAKVWREGQEQLAERELAPGR